jgi:hypothetical protein
MLILGSIEAYNRYNNSIIEVKHIIFSKMFPVLMHKFIYKILINVMKNMTFANFLHIIYKLF